MGRVDNLQEELLKTKKSHAFAMREISILRTKIKILEKECKKKDQQIDELLKNDQFASKSEQRLQLNSLKRKVIQFERALREKTEEVAKLLSDRNIAKAAETRQQLEKLSIECARLRKYLAQSIPQSEYFHEKQQYVEIIDQLTEENMVMRRIIGRLKSNQEEQASNQGLDNEAMMAEFRSLALAKKKDAQHYKAALNSLINQRNSTRNSLNSRDRKSSSCQVTRRSASANHERPTKVPTNKKFPIRAQPILSKVAASRSKSIEETTVIEQRRISRQMSDANLTSVSRPNSDIETAGKEIMMPIRRKIRNNMYRHALDTDSSSSDQADNINQEQLELMDEMIEDEEDDMPEFPLEVYDAKGNVYYIEPEPDDDEPNLDENDAKEIVDEPVENEPDEEIEQNNDSEVAFDPTEKVGELQKQKSTDTWLEIASMLSGQVKLDEESVILRTLYSHVLRLQMLKIRQESL